MGLLGRRYRSVAAAAAGECGQCHFVYIVCWTQLINLLFFELRPVFIVIFYSVYESRYIVDASEMQSSELS